MEKTMNKTTINAFAAKNANDELSADELDAVSAGDIKIIKIFGHTVTGGDVVSAAKWVWNKLF
jgi:hypothetical protein